MSLEVINADKENGTVGCCFEWDANCVNLANAAVRWVPMLPELKELCRSIRLLEPAIEVEWPKGMELWWCHQSTAIIPASHAHPIVANKYLSLQLEVNFSLKCLTGCPVALLQMIDNPRTFWQPSKLKSTGGLFAYWMVRPIDFLGVMILLTRFTEIAVTAPDELWAETHKEFRRQEPLPKWRIRL